jgi:CRP-like cAMP-binding protein
MALPNSPLNFVTFLNNLSIVHRVVQVREKEAFFLQGTPANDVFYLLTGRAKLTVISESGKETTVAIIPAKQFFGEEASASEGGGCRPVTCTAIVHCTAVRIERKEMLRSLIQEAAFAQLFMAFLLAQSMRAQADLVDQLSNSSEKRLARILLLMAAEAKPGQPVALIPEISQETLADMVGTTRSRVSKFMNGFRKQGLIDYKGRIWVHTPLLETMLGE